MADVIREKRIARPERLAFFHSVIPTTSDGSAERTGNVVLFLNGFKHWRHPELVVEATPKILEQVPDARILMVGETGTRSDVQGRVRRRIQDLHLEDSVSTLPFTSAPQRYFDEASVFLLPADIVFCNFALLEAMDRYVVPVVTDVEGANLIVVDGVNGYLVQQSAESIANAVIRVLTNEVERRKFAAAAHDKVASEYSAASMAPDVMRLYAEKVWK
jgi:glycosyltransferase involved in cell wall biosynthesis